MPSARVKGVSRVPSKRSRPRSHLPQSSGRVDVQTEHPLYPAGPGQHPSEASMIQSLHTHRGPHPQGAVKTLRQGCRRHRGQTLRRAQSRQRVALDADKAFRRGDPYRAIPLLEQQAERRLEFPLALCLASRFPVEHLQKTRFGAGPQVVSTIPDDREHQPVRQAVLDAVYRNLSRGPYAGDPTARPQPQVAGMVLLDGAYAVARQSFAHGAGGHAVFLEAVDPSTGGSNPQAAFGVFEEASDHLVGEPVACLVAGQLAFGQPV